MNTRLRDGEHLVFFIFFSSLYIVFTKDATGMRQRDVYTAVRPLLLLSRIRLSRVFASRITSRNAIDRYLHLRVHLIEASFTLWKQVVVKVPFTLSLSLFLSLLSFSHFLFFYLFFDTTSRNFSYNTVQKWSFLPSLSLSSFLSTYFSPRFSAHNTSILRK